jgi:SPP1 gp7 family putative phage head morphogenesis protein
MWGAHQVDGRIAAKNATKIRAALRQSVDAKAVFRQYEATMPNVSDNVAQDRARARAWAIMNLRLNNESLKKALVRLYAEAWVTGDAAAKEAIYEEQQAEKSVTPELTKINEYDEMAIIDWDSWNPGDLASSLLLEPTDAFRELLQESGYLISGLDRTGYELIGTALADSIRLGYSPAKAAKLILDAVGSPARALTIAVTESSRVMNRAALNRYSEAGLERVKWMVVFGGGACDKCAQNDGQIIMLGGTFNSGNTQPPAHPHCRCNLRPVIPDYSNGVNDVANISTKVTKTDKVGLTLEEALMGVVIEWEN